MLPPTDENRTGQKINKKRRRGGQPETENIRHLKGKAEEQRSRLLRWRERGSDFT